MFVVGFFGLGVGGVGGFGGGEGGLGVCFFFRLWLVCFFLVRVLDVFIYKIMCI